jgi:hypothetical protein
LLAFDPDALVVPSHLRRESEEIDEPAEEEEATGEKVEQTPAELTEIETVPADYPEEKPKDVRDPEILLVLPRE